MSDLYEGNSLNNQSDDGIDEDALAMVEAIQRQKNEGTAINKTIQTDSYFRPSNMDSLLKYEEYIKTEQDKISLLAVDLSQPELLESAIAVMNRNSNVFGVAGYGSHAVTAGEGTDINKLRFIVQSNPKILAIGKIGLDFHFAPYTNEKQVELFKEQLDLAIELQKPVFVTSKNADAKLLQIIKEYNAADKKFRGICVPVVRSVDIFELVSENNMYLLVRPEVTYEEEELYRQCIQEMNAEKLLVASGGDLHSPEPHRGKWNCPEHLEHTIKFAANLFDLYPKEFTTQMALNFNAVFNSPPEAGDDVFEFTRSSMSKTLIITEAQLLENDIDDDGDALKIIKIDSETSGGGSVFWDKDNFRLVYTPYGDFTGADKFTYTITDGRGGTDTANVTIHVRQKM